MDSSEVYQFEAEDVERREGKRRDIRYVAAAALVLLVVGVLCGVAVYAVLYGEVAPDVAATEAVAGGDSFAGEVPAGGDAEEPSYEDTTTQGPRTSLTASTVRRRRERPSTIRPSFFNRFPLVCIMGSNAVLPAQYPPDGLCDFYFYTHVVFDDQKGQFLGSQSQDSFKLFTDMAATANRSHYGISFDMKALPRLASVPNESRGQSAFSSLFSNNVEHHGILNVIGNGTMLEQDMNTVLATLPAIRKFQKKHRPRTPDGKTYIIVGVELPNLKEEIKMITRLLFNATKAGANMLLVRTHVAMWDLAEPNGTAGGTMLRNPRGIQQPYIKAALPSLKRLRSPLTILLVSFTMGAALFRLPPEWQDVTDRDTSQIKPLSFEITDYSKVCTLEKRKTVKSFREEIVITGRINGSYQLIFDNKKDILLKMKSVYNRLRIRRSWYSLGWAFFDIERDDYNDSCGPGTSFKRLKAAQELIARDLSRITRPMIGWPPERPDEEDW